MNILIINAGSSSIKYQLIQMPSELIIGKGLIERIGSKNATVKYKTNTVDIEEVMLIPNHSAGFQKMATLLMDPDKGVIANVNDIGIVAHRVVHGGNSFSETTAITQEVKDKIREISILAPLHNPHNLEGILLAEEAFPKAKQIAVFDTAFHQTMPVKAKKYALPNEFYTDHGIQAYGFHGTSHKYVSEKAISFLKLKSSKIITIHLGHGCSITAVRDGKSVDHSMGFTPANGLIMGSRSGDIDHSLIFYLVNNLGYGLEEVNALLSKKSGMLGLTGHRDLRDIEAKAKTGNKECILALEMNAYRIKKYIGAYAAAMNGLDAVVFTAGIGENSSTLRNLVCTDMDYLGITLDPAKNESKSSNIREIGSTNAQVKILVVPTNEELEIAKQAFGLSQNQ
ncbi:acetate/propionate family kinase [Arenibacter algicola]|jgi:acetate kinase|uniref:Acetate kinase n=1 Tax=Arenibacter algicola TaxID=616991 RepID=A0A221V066_9FLAO|nr:acetate kinase [Arenibacter algicola]ASO06982.1 acetate kinase [Arenibacter algicola]|tara:strand:+ start:30809 stop:31999 length:1191 start_codon:yes stop_codon:yes gene_type:complete